MKVSLKISLIKTSLTNIHYQFYTIEGAKLSVIFFVSFFLTFSGSAQVVMSDKSGVYQTTLNQQFFRPADVNHVRDIIKKASASMSRLIVRGKGHSANGSSIPSDNEILLVTDSLKKLSIVNDSTVFIEAGVVMWQAKQMLEDSGYLLEVVNEGGPGPTLGGFISAGGIGSSGQPGFWETVRNVTIVDAEGVTHLITKDNDYFRWLFGSMGLLGFIYGAEVAVTKAIPNTPSIKPEEPAQDVLKQRNFNFYWYPVLVPEKKMDDFDCRIKNMIDSINTQCDLDSGTKLFYNKGGIKIPFLHFTPPLLGADSITYYVVGLKCLVPNTDINFPDVVRCIRKKMDDLLTTTLLHSYFQVSYYEPTPENVKFYLGGDIYEQFRQIKAKMDPKNIFGKPVFN